MEEVEAMINNIQMGSQMMQSEMSGGVPNVKMNQDITPTAGFG